MSPNLENASMLYLSLALVLGTAPLVAWHMLFATEALAPVFAQLMYARAPLIVLGPLALGCSLGVAAALSQRSRAAAAAVAAAEGVPRTRPLTDGKARGWLAAGLALCLAACGRESIAPSEVAGPFTWGGVSNVTHVRHLWFSGQPDQATLERAKAEGVGVVINLRDPSEHDWDEKSAVEALGVSYYNVPVRGTEPFDRAAFVEIEALVEQHHEQQILVHCSSSNRAGGWLATHLVGAHGMSVEDALAVGRLTGITKEAIEENVRKYIGATDR